MASGKETRSMHARHEYTTSGLSHPNYIAIEAGGYFVDGDMVFINMRLSTSQTHNANIDWVIGLPAPRGGPTSPTYVSLSSSNVFDNRLPYVQPGGVGGIRIGYTFSAGSVMIVSGCYLKD